LGHIQQLFKDNLNMALASQCEILHDSKFGDDADADANDAY
jgi:hypothetical protein